MHQALHATMPIINRVCGDVVFEVDRSRRRSSAAHRIRRNHTITFVAFLLLGACCIQSSHSFSIPRRTTTTAQTSCLGSDSFRWKSRLHSKASSPDSKKRGLQLESSTIQEAISTTSQESHNKNTNNNNPNKNRPNNQRRGGGGKNYQRCSVNQNKKRRVRYLFSKARSLEKRGLWREACDILESILELDPTDAHSYLALARLESRRERGSRVGKKKIEGGSSDSNNTTETSTNAMVEKSSKNYQNARQIFQTGTTFCPDSVHLWHAWAMHEQSLTNLPKARELFNKALEIDPWNGYVCHAYGLLELNDGKDTKRARQLWQQGLTYQPSAALVCSLGHLYTTSGHPESARELYATYVHQMKSERERIEVYLAASSLEERVFRDVERASVLLKEALSPGGDSEGSIVHDSRAYIALARLGTSGGLVDDLVVKKRLKEICMKQIKQAKEGDGKKKKFPVKDGRLFNAWAKLESKKSLREARKILGRGVKMYPKDYTLLQAAGNIEERLGNGTAARDLYSASLHIRPSAPALIAYAMLELRSPEGGTEAAARGGSSKKQQPNITKVRKLFDEALLIDPRHGPIYNAYGNLERREGNAEKAKQLYEDGINANCTDAPSVFHGLAKLHLSLGEVEKARSVLQCGLAMSTSGTSVANAYAKRNENVAFLAHTLAMIELNVNNNAKQAKKCLEQGLWHCRNSPQLLLAMALCESRMGNENAARDMFEKSLTADQRHAQAWQAFGVMEMQAGNFKTAKTLFECGLKNSPTHGALWQAYGTLESWKGNIAKARILFAAGIEKCPQHVPLYQAWACLELRSGDSPSDVITAKRLIGEALTRDKRNGSGWLVAAKIEEKMDNHGLVGLILRRGIECAPGDTELYRALAEHQISRGKIDSARELLEKGIEINPLYAPLYHSLAELEARVFNIDGLAKLNKRTAEIFSSDATAPPPQNRMQAFGNNIKQSRSPKMTDGIRALADKIGIDDDSDMTIDEELLEDVDPESLVNSFGAGGGGTGLMFHDGIDMRLM